MKTFRAQAPIWDDSIWLLIGEAGYDGRMTAYVESMTLKTHDPMAVIQDPSMRLDKREAQGLIDALWSAGVRPTSGEGSAGQLGAVERHLEDMRSLVFKGEKT